MVGDRFESSSRNFLLKIIDQNGDKHKIQALSHDNPGDCLSIYGVVEGESRKPRKEKLKNLYQKREAKTEASVCAGCDFGLVFLFFSFCGVFFSHVSLLFFFFFLFRIDWFHDRV